jgi:hypothetical protein
VTHVILAGPTRTGTTSLFRYFLQVENLSCSNVKETNFFLDAIWDQGAAHVRMEYEKFFSAQKSIYLKASPMYFCGGTPVATAIANCLGRDAVKIIVVLRDPVERFISLYNHIELKRDADFDLTFQQFFDICGNSTRNQTTSLKDVSNIGLLEGNYGVLLEEWLNIFPAKNLHIVFFEQLLKEPTVVQESLCRFLEIPTIRGTDIGSYNETRFVKSDFLHNYTMRMNNALEPVFNRMPDWIRNSLRNAYYRWVSS